MINQQILDYISQQLLQGIPKETVSGNLLSQGWSQQDVNDAFSQVANQNTAPPTAIPATQANVVIAATGGATAESRAKTGLILGIIALPSLVIAIVSFAVSVAGLIFSIQGLKSLKRGMAITGIILSSIGLLASIGSGIFGYYQAVNGQNWFVNKFINKNTNTLDEKAYTNDNYGFKINPPKGWIVDASGKFGIVKFSNPKADLEGTNSLPASIGVAIESAQGMDLETYINASKEILKKIPDYKPVDELSIMLYGVPARIINSAVTMGGVRARTMQLITIKNGQAYVVTAGAIESTWNQHQNLLRSSLMTFAAYDQIKTDKPQPAPTLKPKPTTQPTPVPTPSAIINTLDEKAYVSSKYGFKINPPKGWIVNDSGNADALVWFFNTKVDQENGTPFSANIQVSSKSANGDDIDSYIKSMKASAPTELSNSKFVEDRTVSINGLPARILGVIFELNGLHMRVQELFVKKEGEVYEIIAIVLESSWDKYENLINSSLLTFSLN